MRAPLALTLALVGATPALAAPAGADPAPSARQQALYDAFSARDAGPACSSLGPVDADLHADLMFLVEQAVQPPWVAVRAADCLLQLDPLGTQAAARRWVVAQDSRGLALLALAKLDSLPRPMAIDLAQTARRGALAADATPRIAKAQTAEIRAIAALPVDQLPPLPAELQALAR